MENRKTIIVQGEFKLIGEIAVNVPENFKSKNLDKIRNQFDKQNPDSYLSELLVLDNFVEWASVNDEPMFRPDVIQLLRVAEIGIINEDMDGINELL